MNDKTREELLKKYNVSDEEDFSSGNEERSFKADFDEDDDQNFIKKDEPQEEKSTEETLNNAKEGTIFGRIKKAILPFSGSKRDLSVETGGLEEDKSKGKYSNEKISSSDKEGGDIWDNRSEEVDEMGSTDVFNTTGMRSVVWRKKKERLDKKKRKREEIEEGMEGLLSMEIKRHKADKENPIQFSHANNVMQARNNSQGGGGRGL